MRLFEFFHDTEITLDLAATTKQAALEEMVGLFGLDDDAQQLLVKLLKKRENLGSTGIFLIVAPPVEISNQYLPVLGKIAQFCKNEQNIAQLNDVSSTDEFLAVLKDAEV
jgi:mannitol/fructose-specific phosphotransferase system IIA component (Ntr-type)